MFRKLFGFKDKKGDKDKNKEYKGFNDDNQTDIESSDDMSGSFDTLNTQNSPTSELDLKDIHFYYDDGKDEATEQPDITEISFSDADVEGEENDVDILDIDIDAPQHHFMDSYDKPIEDDQTIEPVSENTQENIDDGDSFIPVVEAEDTQDNVEANVEKKGFFARLKEGLSKTRTALGANIDNVLKAFSSIDEDLYEALEEALIMADIGAETSMYIIEQLRSKVKANHIKENAEVKNALREIISEIMSYDNNGLVLNTKPSVMIVIGVNGVGKTTSIGKIASRLKEEGKSVLLAAGDSFRAGAIDQLQVWADRVDVPIVKHQEGADPGAVIFDAIASAKAKNVDVVICDTAGRLHNKANLMKELEKIFRIIDRELPDADKEVLLVLDATTGQNAVTQAKTFGDVAKLTGIVLTKLDGTAKGGIVITISKELSIPVKLIGVGEGVDDMREFVPADYALALFPEEE